MTLDLKYYNQEPSITLRSEKYGFIGKLSKNCIARLTKRKLDSLQIECVACCIVEYYQADRSFYEKAGYLGVENSHHIVIPFLKITQQLS